MISDWWRKAKERNQKVKNRGVISEGGAVQFNLEGLRFSQDELDSIRNFTKEKPNEH